MTDEGRGGPTGDMVAVSGDLETPRERSFGHVVSAYGVGRRFLTLCGPDTFLRQKIMHEGGAYPELSSQTRRRIDLALRVGYPLLLDRSRSRP